MLCTCPVGLLCPGILWGDSPTARQWGEGLLKNALMVLSPPDLGKQLAKMGLDAALLADVIAEAGQHAGWRGMSMLQLPSSLTVRKSMNVILRQHTLDVNDVALKHLTLKGARKGPAVLITGPPRHRQVHVVPARAGAWANAGPSGSSSSRHHHRAAATPYSAQADVQRGPHHKERHRHHIGGR